MTITQTRWCTRQPSGTPDEPSGTPDKPSGAQTSAQRLLEASLGPD